MKGRKHGGFRPKRKFAPALARGAPVLFAILIAVGCGDPTDSELEVQHDPERYIRGGREARPGAYPFAAVIGRARSFYFDSRCGGTLIRPRWVLTAAHCNVSTDDSVIIGRHNLDANDGVLVPIFDVFVPDSYERSIYRDDVALVLLTRPARTSARSLWPTIDVQLVASELADSEELVVIGWGRTGPNSPAATTLQEVRVPIVENRECETSLPPGRKRLPGMFCAGDEFHDACHGDSGGPIMRVGADGDSLVQVGVVSWGGECGSPGPGVYADLSHHRGWLERTLLRNDTAGLDVSIAWSHVIGGRALLP